MERERPIPSDITYMWDLKYGINKPIYKIETDSQTENRLMVARGRGREREGGGVGG